MITDFQKRFIQLELDGKIKRNKEPRKFSAYERRMQERIDHMIRNGKWLANKRPDILQNIKAWKRGEAQRYQRARDLLQIVALFEREDIVLSLIAEIYSDHQLELTKKK